jgi:hypothetical protein
MKAILTVVVYLVLICALGIVIALTGGSDPNEDKLPPEDF